MTNFNLAISLKTFKPELKRATLKQLFYFVQLHDKIVCRL